MELIVLIESDWNLKPVETLVYVVHLESINRIRLEFKGQKTDRKNQNRRKRINRIRLEFKAKIYNLPLWRYGCINRIRLEFKANNSPVGIDANIVLIESDWNLKLCH